MRKLAVVLLGVLFAVDVCAEAGLDDYDARLVSIGFDDFRASDFTLVEPLFTHYGATATYNNPPWTNGLDSVALARIRTLEAHGNEVGDHTWFHWNGLFDDPQMNGQDPSRPDGGQTPFPSNAEMRDDRGDGRNAFGFPLTDSVDVQLSDFWAYGDRRFSAVSAPWGKLSDAECQKIRDYFSVFGNTCGFLDTFDRLSNRHLGTTGRSRGSWNAEKGCYTGGIFTGCRTSSNHEIWERVLQLTRAVYRESCRTNFSFVTWSWPGSIPSPFLFEKDGRFFYDAARTLPANALARFPSSLLRDADGRPLARSFTEALRSEGYKTTHDMTYPSRRDGTAPTAMRRQLFANAGFSRRDALAYSTERTVHYDTIAREYPEAYFGGDTNNAAAKMYDGGGSFRAFVEAVRHETASGLVHGEVIDSVDTFSERMFLDRALAFCRAAGVRVCSKREAYEACFARTNVCGNLIRNVTFRNSAAEFLPGARKVPANPDGYLGACHVETAAGVRTLVTEGPVTNIVYGVPTGELAYSAHATGTGRIRILALRNRSALTLEGLESLAVIDVAATEPTPRSVRFIVPDAPETAYEPRWEGLGDKVMGLVIVYSSGLALRDVRLCLSAAPWPGFSRGMGIGGWLTNYKRFNVLPEDKRLLITEGDLEHFDSYITEADVKNIKAMGFDHIRLGFDQIVLEESPGVWRERTFRKVDDFIRWCAANGMNVVLNLHKAVGNYCDIPEKVQLLDDAALQARFIALWLEMERRYHDRPGLAFEILNEVRDVDPAKWNGLADRTVRAIRAKNPDRWIVVGPTCWNAPHALGALRVWDDPKVVYTFHMYEPFEFTHQRGVLQASPLAYNRELDYPCDDVERYRGFHRLHGNANSYANVTRIDRRILAERLAPAFAWAKAHPDKILWNGEFGTIRHAPKASRVAYMRDVVSLCREHGIPWCVWNYLSTPNDGNRFSLVDDDTRKILSPELLSACLGECAEGVGASLPANAAHAFSTLRLPATPENWPSQREMLAHSRDCFDEVWFSACNFESLSANEARSAFLAGAARDIRAMGYVASLEFELTIGNDDGPDSPRMPFKDWTGFTGPDGWEGVRCNCPRDPKFHAYFRDQLRHYCSWKPHTIWLDDDVRVENHGKNPNGCYCRRCVDTFAKAEGRAWTRETLVAAMKEDKALAARWRAHCFRGLAEFAYAFCKAVKEFSPETRVGFQYPWADEGQLFILEAMAKAAGEKIAMRPGSCHYHDWNPYGLIDKTYRMQEQMKVLSPRFDLFDRLCPEIETYPRNFTQRTARSLGFEALMHLATGMDSLTWYIAGNAEPCDWYERNVFKAPRANMWLYREYVARNRGAEPVGFGAAPHEIGQGTPGLDWWAAPSCVPYNFGTGRTLGTVLWDGPALHAVSDDGLKAILRGGVLADLAAVRHLVSRKLVPADAAELDKTLLSDSTERHSRLVTLPSGGRMAVFPGLSPIGATSRELLRYGHLADAVCGGKMPILFEEPALDVVLPRVFADGSFASAVIVNTRIDEQESARVRIRNLKGDAVLWFALWSKAPVRLPVERDAKTGDALVTLPPIGHWSGGFLAPTGER